MKGYMATISQEVDFNRTQSYFLQKGANIVQVIKMSRVIVFEAHNDDLPGIKAILGVLTVENEPTIGV